MLTRASQVFRSPKAKSLSVADSVSDERVSVMNEPKHAGGAEPIAANASVRLIAPSTNSGGSRVLTGSLGPGLSLASLGQGAGTLWPVGKAVDGPSEIAHMSTTVPPGPGFPSLSLVMSHRTPVPIDVNVPAPSGYIGTGARSHRSAKRAVP